jgi:hypothetical protein
MFVFVVDYYAEELSSFYRLHCNRPKSSCGIHSWKTDLRYFLHQTKCVLSMVRAGDVPASSVHHGPSVSRNAANCTSFDVERSFDVSFPSILVAVRKQSPHASANSLLP